MLRLVNRFGLEERGVKGKLEGETGAIDHENAAYPLRMGEDELERHPPAHRPSAKVGTRQVLAVEELLEDLHLERNRIVNIGAIRSAKAEQVNGINPITVPREPGYQSGPTLRHHAQTMHQPTYSYLSVTMGSTFVARRAGR